MRWRRSSISSSATACRAMRGRPKRGWRKPRDGKGDVMSVTTDTAKDSARPAGLKPTQLNNAVAVEIQGMNKWYGAFHVLRDINLRVQRGERIVICGPSGSGKSTMIRCINCLEEH